MLVGELLLEVGDAEDVSSDRARVEDADTFDGVADHVGSETATDDLNLGKLRHGRRSG
jgi:hypothetical protein